MAASTRFMFMEVSYDQTTFISYETPFSFSLTLTV